MRYKLVKLNEVPLVDGGNYYEQASHLKGYDGRDGTLVLIVRPHAIPRAKTAIEVALSRFIEVRFVRTPRWVGECTLYRKVFT